MKKILIIIAVIGIIFPRFAFSIEKIWSVKAGDTISRFHYSTDKKYIYTIGDKKFKTWDALTGVLISSKDIPIDANSYDVTVDGKYIIASAYNNRDYSSEDTIFQWDIMGNILDTIYKHHADPGFVICGIEVIATNEIGKVIIEPNPAKSITAFNYYLSKKGYVTFSIWTLQGIEVKNLVNEVQDGGYHIAYLNTNSLKTGSYMFKLFIEGNYYTGIFQIVK